MRSAIKITALAGLIGALGAGVFGLRTLRQHNARLRTQARELRRETGESEREPEREEHRRLTVLVEQMKRGETEATPALHGELEKARRDVAELERRAHVSHEATVGRASVNQENRDPEKGFARLEYFENEGRGTVTAAFQTMVWAALKGDDATVVDGLTVTDAGRRQAAELSERLPQEMRGKYPTPESLAATVVTSEILKTPAVQIVGYVLTDAQHATLTVRQLTAADQEMKLPMELGPGGWRMVVSDRVIATLNERMREAGTNR